MDLGACVALTRWHRMRAGPVMYQRQSTAAGEKIIEKIGEMFAGAGAALPERGGLDIGWGCDKLIATAADLAPVRSALATSPSSPTARRRSTRATWPTGKDQAWSSPPGDAQVELDSVASLPEMTDVGGTTLSTDGDGRWLSGGPRRRAAIPVAPGGIQPVRPPRLAARCCPTRIPAVG